MVLNTLITIAVFVVCVISSCYVAEWHFSTRHNKTHTRKTTRVTKYEDGHSCMECMYAIRWGEFIKSERIDNSMHCMNKKLKISLYEDGFRSCASHNSDGRCPEFKPRTKNQLPVSPRKFSKVNPPFSGGLSGGFGI